MFRSLLFVAALIGFSPRLTAVPCFAGSLDTYIAAGCTNFGIDFSGWSYSPGGSSVSAGDIAVFPSVAGPVFEFTVFAAGGWAAGPGGVVTPSIDFTATSSSSAVGGYLFLAFGTSSGTGTVSATLEQCLGGLFAGGCVGTATAIGVTPPALLATNAFAGSFDPIGLRLSMTISGGTGGAMISSLEAGLFAVPEPAAIWLMGLGVGAVACRRSHKRT